MKKILAVVAGVVVVLAVVGFVLFALNTAPRVPQVSASEASNPTKPYVVKLHAQWCAACMMTKGVWAKVSESYAGKVNLLVLDFTNEEKTAASREEAKRLGLDAFFNEHAGTTGSIMILDGKSKTVKRELEGSRDFADYRAAIEAVLTGVNK